MSDLEIVDLDPFDSSAFDAWHAVYLSAETHGREETATAWQLEELRVAMQERASRKWTAGVCGVVDGRVVTAGWVETPLLDNLDRAVVSVHTLPGEQGRGYATATLAHLERVALQRGRTVLGAECSWSYAAGPEGAGESGPGFARSRGFTLALSDVQRALDLPVDAALLDRLADEAASHHAAYTLRSWVGPVPDDLLAAGWAELTSSLMTEAPTGELHLEPEAVDAAVVREQEAAIAAQGRTKYNTVALDAAGAVVAYTDLAITAHEPDRAYQWGTLVRRSDRGHRLGLAVKLSNLRLLQRERPGITRLTTYNAEVNASMIGVNEQLGFVPVARLGEFQKHLT